MSESEIKTSKLSAPWTGTTHEQSNCQISSSIVRQVGIAESSLSRKNPEVDLSSADMHCIMLKCAISAFDL